MYPVLLVSQSSRKKSIPPPPPTDYLTQVENVFLWGEIVRVMRRVDVAAEERDRERGGGIERKDILGLRERKVKTFTTSRV